MTAAATGSADPSTTPESSPPDSPLTAGLLPASDLGVDEVHQFSLDGGSSSDHHGPWGPWGWDQADVTPSGCSTAVQDAMSGLPGLQDGVGQVGRANDVRTFEVLAVPKSQVNAVDELRTVMNACDGATIDRQGTDGDQDHGSVTVSVDELSGVPDQTAAFSVTLSGDRPDGTWSTTALVGVGDDGARVLGLAQMSWDQQLDTASFTALFTKAYTVQHDALH